MVTATEPDRDQPTGICDAVEELRRGRSGRHPGLLQRANARSVRPLRPSADRSAPTTWMFSSSTPGCRRPSSTGSSPPTTDVASSWPPTWPRRRSRCPACASSSTPGTARISRFSRRTKVQRLPIEPVSQASANQRAGRCGRVAPGICVRLYDEDDFDGRPEFTEPEIMRTNLASVILTMATLRLGDVTDFPFVDPPPSRSITDGITLLEELGALDPAERRRTPLGNPRGPQARPTCRWIRASAAWCWPRPSWDAPREVMVLAAAMSLQDPRERPAEHQQAAAEQPRPLRRPVQRLRHPAEPLGVRPRAAARPTAETSSAGGASASSSTTDG